MASGRRKRLAEAVRGEVLTPAGLSSYLDADLGVASSQTKIALTALYASGGLTPSFVNGSTTVLSDEVSNADGNWTLIGYDGETDANATIVTGSTVFLPSTTIHRYLPYPGPEITITVVTQSVPALIYSSDGPQGYFNQSYLPTVSQTSSVGILTFASQITGAAAGMPRLKITVAGAVPTGSLLLLFTGSLDSNAGLQFSSSTAITQTLSVLTSSISSVSLAYSSSNSTVNTFGPGFLVYITGSAT